MTGGAIDSYGVVCLFTDGLFAVVYFSVTHKNLTACVLLSCVCLRGGEAAGPVRSLSPRASSAADERMPGALTAVVAVLMGIPTASALSLGDARPTVVVAGATGKAGSAVVRSLVESGGVDIVALVRSAAKARTLYGEDSGVEIAEADYADTDALDAVLREHQACRIFIACANGPNQARLEVNLCEAAKRHGASYAVKLSTATPVLEMKAGGPYGAHLEAEAALAASP